ncbi:MAG: diguanylate cyclase [Spirochaetia bacterium]|nr:diguanylate cyclase [Spirochaetia bacterium]
MHVNIISIIWILSSFIVLFDGWLCLSRKRVRGSKEFAIVNFAIAWYVFFTAFELMSVELDQVLFFTHLEYIATTFLPALLINFVLKFLDYDSPYNNPILIALSIIAFAELILQWTTTSHGLVYRNVHLQAYGNLWVIHFEKGPVYILGAIIQELSIIGSMILFINALSKAKGTLRTQLSLIIIALSIPLAVFLLYIFSAIPVPYDINSFSFTLVSIFTTILLLRVDMFTFAPVKQGRVFMSMRESCVIVDENGRIVDMNQRAKEMLPFLNSDVIGEKALDVFAIFPSLIEIMIHPEEQEIELNASSVGGPEWILAKISLLNEGRKDSIVYAIFFEDTTERHRMLESLQYYATQDDLTGLFNRRYFYEAIKPGIEVSITKGSEVSIIMIDIDSFKEVNDAHGHAIGDKVLRSCAKVLAAKLESESDAIIGRFGGDEFIVFLPEASLEEAQRIAEKLRLSVVAMPILEEIERPLHISVGVSAHQIARLEEIEMLISKADDALYKAKRSGGNRVCI